MEKVRKAVLECMRNCTPDDDLISTLNSVVEQEGELACKIIMDMVAHRDCDPREAARHWEAILCHQTDLSGILGRTVSLQVAVCDYLHWIDKSLGYPKLIDVGKFEEIFAQARRDFLTGLYNRQEFEEAIRREVARAKRYERKVSLLFFDLDTFKKLNDQYGHLAGDKALQYLAACIAKDKRIEDIAARYGGDEFVLLLPDIGKKDALLFGERFREMVASRKIPFDGHLLTVTISGGVATCPDDGRSADRLIHCADKALHISKRDGKNRISAYKKEIRQFVRRPYFEKIKGTTFSGKHNVAMLAESKNLSGGGILLENNFSVHLGSVVEICLVLEGRVLTVLGEVVRTDQLATDRFDIGVSFFKKQDSVQQVVDNYVLKNLLHSPVPIQ